MPIAEKRLGTRSVQCLLACPECPDLSRPKTGRVGVQMSSFEKELYPRLRNSIPTKVPTLSFSVGPFRRIYLCKCLKGLAPQVGLEPTTLRLTAEFQGEAVRSGKRKLLKIGVSQSWSRPQFRIACKKSSYKSSYSACGYRNCLSHGWAFRGNEPSGRVSSSIPISPPVMTRAG